MSKKNRLSKALLIILPLTLLVLGPSGLTAQEKEEEAVVKPVAEQEQETAPAPVEPEKPKKKGKIGFSLFGGWSLREINNSSQYRDTWAQGAFQNYNETTDLTVKSKSGGPMYGGSLLFYLNDTMGLQLMGGIFSQDLTTKSSSLQTWDLHDDPDIIHGEKKYEYSGTGKLGTTPISLNFFKRFGKGKIGFTLSGGPTYFMNSLQANSHAVYADYRKYSTTITVIIWPWIFTYYVTIEEIDHFKIPVKIDQKWNGIGANLGGMFDIKLSKAITLFLEARYYYCPAKTYDWSWTSGKYNGLLDNWDNYNFTAATAGKAAAKTTKLTVNPSFPHVGLGIIIRI